MKCWEHTVQTGRTYSTNENFIQYKSEYKEEPIYASVCMDPRIRAFVPFDLRWTEGQQLVNGRAT